MPRQSDAVLLLASSSPRRRELLRSVGVEVRLARVAVDESPLPRESGAGLSLRLARAKALAAAARRPGSPVLAADTVVVVGRRIFGKPSSRAEARRMLSALSGRWHDVVSSVALVTPGGRLLTERARTRVRFARLTRAEIARYTASGEPADKAGAYALQGAAGWFVAEIHGSASNVVGLPLEKVRRLFARARLPLPPLAR